MTNPIRIDFRAAVALCLLAAAACSRSPEDAAVGQNSDPLFVNGGFEDGTRSNWTLTAKRNTSGLAAVPPASYAQLQLQNCTLGSNCYDYTYVRSGATPESVPLYGLSAATNPPKLPKFGTYSLVVNEGGKNYNVNTVQQTYTTTNADVDPADGKIHVRFSLAPALQNPGHADAQQPYFYVILRNSTRGTTLYQTFNFANQPGIPWSTYNDPVNGAVQYTAWQIFDVAPGNGYLTVGDTVNLEVVAAGCSLSGHWGEVAVDGFGAQLPTISIAATGPASANAGTNITYTFLAKNSTSFLASNVVATETTPPNTTFVSMVPPSGVTCTTPAVGGTGTITCPLGWMNPSSSATFQVTVHINSGATGVINNGNYTIGGDGVTPLLGPNVQTSITSGITYADLGVAVSDGVPGVVWGGPVAYTITVTNSGPSAVAGATVTDTFPAQLTGVAWTCSATGGGSCQSASGSGNISRTVTLPVGATATFAVSATVVAGSGSGTLTNSATVAVPGGVTDPSTSNNADTDVDGIGTLYPVTVDKGAAETGQGTVVSSPAAISCGIGCSSATASFLGGTTVILTAIARAGDTFTGWTGACTGTANPCVITVAAAASVTAHFDGPYVVGSVTGGNGTVTCDSPVAQGSPSTCLIAPSAGYALDTLTDNGSDAYGSVVAGSYTIASVTANHAVAGTFKKALGNTCAGTGECHSGNCVDGVCCNTACTGQCQACDLAGNAGTCRTLPSGAAPHGARTACATDGSACGGACDGANPAACAYPGASTQCRGASCAAGTETLAASCAGTGFCPAAQTLACTPYVCGATACLATCSGDADCVAGDYCASGACVPRLVNGSSCSGANQCATGNCVDGVCCNTACNGQCQACDVAGSVGTCATVTGAPRGPRTVCASDGSACGGACDGANPAACAYPGASTQCRGASCTSGTETLAASCAGTGSCPAVQTLACTPYVCGATACRTSCAADGDCIAGDYCASGACVPRLGNGSACSGANQCQSGNCVDGVCCNTACNGQCEACDSAGSVGTCATVTGAPHGARTACTTDGSACGGACDGANASACSYPGASTECRGASCASGTETLAASCAGTGRCPAVQTQDCTPYVCGATACRTSCAADGDCVAADYCASGACVPKVAQGTACGAGNECATGHCVDGVCCDVACNGQCQACDVGTSVGTCTAASGAPHGTRTACASDGSSCGGACDGVLTSGCAYPGNTSECRAASCSGGVSTLAAACDGAGNCPALQTQACTPYACGSTTCLGNCVTDGDCSSGSFCAGGVCTPKLGPGTACAGPNQCQTGFCADGVCCDQACNGQCQACDAIGSAGTCVAVTGSPRGARPACASDGSSCGGACDGVATTACAYPTSECRPASCSGGVATLTAACDGAGSCPAEQAQACAPFVCGTAACLGNCLADGDCQAGNFCSAGVCAPKLGPGTPCAGPNQCQSGFCTDGVCCDSACGGQCQACDVPGSVGACVAATGSPHGARPVCTGTGSACGGACDGVDTASCAYPGAGTECRTASCSGGAATLAAACDGAGGCPAPQTQSCAPFVCGPAACLGNCSSDADCDAASFCSGGVCAPRLAPGTPCAGANQCASGFCTDGVCCDQACDGQCQACDVPGHAGACTAVAGAPHGARPACASDGSACAGACDGSSPVACAYPGSSVTCRAASCASGVATLASTCDGAGACPARQDASCGVYTCSGDACGSACSTDADCAAGNVCIDGACGSGGSTGGWLVSGSGGCSSAGRADLAPLALVLCLLPLLRRRRLARVPAVARRPRAAARSGAVALLVALLIATPARAQTSSTSFEAQRFQPMGGVWDILGVESAHVAGHLEKGAVLYLNYASQPLRLVSASDPSVQQPLLEGQTGLDIGASIGLFGWLEASLVLPMTAAQATSTAGAIDPALGTETAAAGLGDLRIAPKVRLLELPALALALALPVTFPTGKASGYMGQDGVTGGATAIAEYGGPGGFRAVANVGVVFRSAVQLMNLDVGNALTYGLGSEVPFALLGQRFAGLATLVGQMGLSGGQAAVEAPLELLAGVRWYAPLGLTAAAGGGPGLTDGYGTPTYRLFFSLGFGPSLPQAAAAPWPEPVVAAPPPPPPPPPAPPPPPPEPVVVAPPPPPVEPPPPPAKAVLEDHRILILEQVHFASDEDVILESSFDLLDQVAHVLLANPQVKKVRVEGHTDDRGGARHNEDLSRRRAAKVRDFLIAKGVDASRLESAGYGPTRPVASNATKDGRASNRRVEFVIVEQAVAVRS